MSSHLNDKFSQSYSADISALKKLSAASDVMNQGLKQKESLSVEISKRNTGDFINYGSQCAGLSYITQHLRGIRFKL